MNESLRDMIAVHEVLTSSSLEKDIIIQRNTHECMIKDCKKKPTVQTVTSCITCTEHGKKWRKPFVNMQTKRVDN